MAAGFTTSEGRAETTIYTMNNQTHGLITRHIWCLIYVKQQGCMNSGKVPSPHALVPLKSNHPVT